LSLPLSAGVLLTHLTQEGVIIIKNFLKALRLYTSKLMLNSKKTSITLALLVSGPFAHVQAESQMDDLLAMSLDELLKVEITTGTEKVLAEAPAIASVITAQQIREMGAKNLAEVLQIIPGLHVSKNTFLYGPKFIFRGLTSATAPQALILVDGISLKSAFDGDSNNIWGEYPIQAIARIEVLRGPGSALHGADAFSGVINIITKKYSDIDSGEFGAALGSFNTRNLWFNKAFLLGDWESTFSAEYLASDGHKETLTDGLGVTGPVNVEFKNTDLFFNTANKNWQFVLGWQNRHDVGSGQGLLEILDQNGLWGTEKVLAQARYTTNSWAQALESEVLVNYMQNKQTVERSPFLLPPFAYPPNGLIGEPEYSEYTAKLEFKNSYSGVDNHIITLGVGYQYTDMYEVKERKNFNNDLSPKAGLEDVSDLPDEVFLPEKDRGNVYLYVQDEIKLSQRIEATLGVRYDHYSDFGSTINPRAALVWKTTDTLTTRLMYGEAFRAPSFVELFAVNNPASLGDPNLQPENIRSLDMAINYRPDATLSMSVNIFAYKVTDLLSTVAIDNASFQFANVGEQEGYGFESEFEYQLSTHVSLAGHYAYFKNKDTIVNDDAGDAPNNQAGLRINWTATDNLSLYVGGSYVGEQKRQPADIRASLSSYSFIDISVRYRLDKLGMEFQLSGKNVLDEDIREPSEPVLSPASFNILNDLPQAGASVFFSLRKSL